VICGVEPSFSYKQQLSVSGVLKTMAAFLRQKSRSICAICLEELKNGRCLPCLHSFCLGCLERNYKNKLPGNDVPCPLCRTIFQIPENGLDKLKIPTDGRESETTCEVCSTAQDIKPATVYCIDCSQPLCERCSLPHKKMRGGPHSLRQLDDEPDALEFGLLTRCDEHAEERAESYCFDCKLSICTKCFADSHKQHNCQKFEAIACRKAMLHVESKSGKFLDSMKAMKQQVKEKGEAVKRVVDGHVKDLLTQLDEIESDAMTEATAVTEVLRVALKADAEHSSTAQQSKATAGDLIMTCIGIANDYSAPDVAFVPSDIDDRTGDHNIVGSVLKTVNSGKWVMFQTAVILN